MNWLATGAPLYQSTIGSLADNLREQVDNPWNVADDLDPSITTAADAYRSQVHAQISASPNWRKVAHYKSLAKVVLKSGKPLHLLTQDDLSEHFVPYGENNEHHLATGIGTIFTNYVVDRSMSTTCQCSVDVRQTVTGTCATR